MSLRGLELRWARPAVALPVPRHQSQTISSSFWRRSMSFSGSTTRPPATSCCKMNLTRLLGLAGDRPERRRSPSLRRLRRSRRSLVRDDLGGRMATTATALRRRTTSTRLDGFRSTDGAPASALGQPRLSPSRASTTIPSSLEANDYVGGFPRVTTVAISIRNVSCTFVDTSRLRLPPALPDPGCPGDGTRRHDPVSSSTNGTDVSGNSMRVTEMTNYLSNSADLHVHVDGGRAVSSRPQRRSAGRHLEHVPNTTTYQVQYRNGLLVTAMASGTACGRLRLSQGPLLRGRRLERHADPGPAGRDRSRCRACRSRCPR